ncbi:hypothetical protein L1987_10757 [Smallanthus sonchifolius]|uniref:Uncharacterized protein n=1 Tax=Smallanthus sonchifolius TaxID=185202 RepID=A0ACB9JB48_9ASTR|nr:hypothetical protein L1987_10757 [Smallanthus sonchifolius]
MLIICLILVHHTTYDIFKLLNLGSLATKGRSSHLLEDSSLNPSILNFRTAGMIVDDEINDTIVRLLKSGGKLHAIIDAFHSGTILDLPQVYSTKKHAISISACEDDQLAADTSGTGTHLLKNGNGQSKQGCSLAYAGEFESVNTSMCPNGQHYVSLIAIDYDLEHLDFMKHTVSSEL